MTKLQSQKEKVVIKAFKKLLRCGKDYTAESMYEEAGKRFFLTKRGTQNIVNKYYRNVITDDMIHFVNDFKGTVKERELCFSSKFNLCDRESSLIIEYIKRKK